MARPRARLLPNVTGLHVGGEAQELLLHRVDLGKICRDVMVAAALAGDQVEAAARERLGRTCAAEMNYRGEFLRLLPTGRPFWRCARIAVTLRPKNTAVSSMAWLGTTRV
jgi:hypothetical protein